MVNGRRDFLKALSAIGLGALPAPGKAGSPAPRQGGAAACKAAAGALYVPSNSGFLGRLEPGDEPFSLRASWLRGDHAADFSQGYVVHYRGKEYVNPTLVLQTGQRVRVDFENAIDEPTIVHWHGLCVESRNDGSGMSVVEAGGRYAYNFEVCDRSSLYWYHPHPHGMAAGQVYRGLFGMIEVEDADERKLRAALDLTVGNTEIPIVLNDRRAGGYHVNHHDRMHGFVGDRFLVNGDACPYFDVATRLYRFRILNASNARIYRLAFRGKDGQSLPFLLIGGDGGLLSSPRQSTEAFVATGERLDVLVDFSSLASGDDVELVTLPFDPMHMEMAMHMNHADMMKSGAMNHGAMGHGAMDHAAMDHGGMHHSATDPAAMDHAAMDGAALDHGAMLADGAPRSLLQIRVRQQAQQRFALADQLSTIAHIDTTTAPERLMQLGFADGRWRINGRVFEMDAPVEIKRDSVETWVIRNPADSMPHAMHLHGFHFQVLERQGSPEQIARLATDKRKRLATDHGLRDTVLVWPGETVRVAIDFQLPFPGSHTYMFHCHNLEHEDAGMMLGLKIV